LSAADRLNTALEDRYRVERELGAGGMATVYLAEDLKHDRKVAVKVLKPELTAVLGADRFIQEIKTTASLQHPHILPLFDSGTADGFLFYVMPYIEGETLRNKLDRETQLGIDEAVRITREVADALDYAHRNGIIHRDIKPENILLHDGRPMVADFGIALAVSAAAGGRMTETGTSVGTPHYMSPEQATADKEITGRADQYSLASVLYEMLTGEPPHMGNSAQAVIMKIIAEPVKPVTALRKNVAPNVAAAVQKALEKLPADRFESAKVFADALADPAFRTATIGVAGASAPGGVRVIGLEVSWRTVAGVLGAGWVALAAWGITTGRGRPAAGPVVRAEVDILTRSDSTAQVPGLDIAPDGSALAYSARLGSDTTTRLYIRRLEDRVARPIPGTEGAEALSFSPDGQMIAFTVPARGIRRVQTGGGPIQAILADTSVDWVNGLRWAADGFLYYDNNLSDGILRVPAQGGTPEILVQIPFSRGATSRRSSRGDQPRDPFPLPGGRHLLYTRSFGPLRDDSVRVLDLETRTTQSLGVRSSAVRYLAGGYLLLIRNGGLDAVAFDARRLALGGEPFTVLDSVSANGSVGRFAVAQNGTAVYTVRVVRGALITAPAQLALVDLEGRQERIGLPAVLLAGASLSPDGRRVASLIVPDLAETTGELMVHDLLLGTTTRRPVPGSGSVVWASDDRLIFSTYRMNDRAGMLLVAAADGTGAPDTLLEAQPGVSFGSLSATRDGGRILLSRTRGGNTDLVTAALGTTLGPVSEYLAADWSEDDGAISPDGRWVAYTSDEESDAAVTQRALALRVYVRSFPEPGPRFPVSAGPGQSPHWSPDGRTIYYRRDSTFVAASVETTPTFAVRSRRNLFTARSASIEDVHPDGTRFLMRVSDANRAQAARPTPEPPRLVIVVNWLEELERKRREAK